MAEQATETAVVESATAMAGDLKAKTDAALSKVMGGGFDDPEFEASLQAAIDKDAGKVVEEKAPEEKAEVTEKAQEQKPAKEEKKIVIEEVKDEIPAELLGEKKAEEKKQEVEPATEEERKKFLEEQTKGMTPKAADRFKKIEARAYEAEQKAKRLADERAAEKVALEKRIEELNLKSAEKTEESKEVERLRKQVEDLDAIVSKSALQEHPKFKEAYDNKISAEIERVKKIAPEAQAGELASLLALPESAKRNERITEIIEEFEDIKKTKVLAAIEKVDRLASERSEELSKWKENKVHIESLELKNRETSAAQIQELQKVAWAKGMSAVTSGEGGLEVFKKAEGNDEWNARVDSRVASVKAILTSQNIAPEKLVEIAARSVASEEYRRMFLSQRILVKALKEELASLKAAEPDASKAGAVSSLQPDNDDFVTAATKGAVRSGAIKE